MNKKEAMERLINAAIDWRIADEAEPIPSNVVKKRQVELAYAVDAFLACDPGLHGILLNNYQAKD